MSVSPTQLTTVDRCARSWYFQKVVKLYVPSSKTQCFGDAIHRLCAAYLIGDQPPHDWSKEVNDEEARDCIELMNEAIASKELRQRDGLLTEHSFNMTVGSQSINGIIDVYDVAGGIVEDHKVVASAHWAKTKLDLRKDIPMHVYAGYLLKETPRDLIWLRHNQFIRDTGRVTSTEIGVTRAEVRAFWAKRIVPQFNTMARTIDVESWEAVAGYDRKSEPCTAYGGCAFAAICHKGLSVEQFSSPAPEKNGAPF